MSSEVWKSIFGGGNQPMTHHHAATLSPKPSDEDPLAVITWYLLSDLTTNCLIKGPVAEFDIHKYDFVPFPTATTTNNQKNQFPIVALTFVRCSFGQRGIEVDAELRLTIIQHTLMELTKLHAAKALMVYRVNHEAHPNLHIIYNDHIIPQLNKHHQHLLAHPIAQDPKHNSIQIILN